MLQLTICRGLIFLLFFWGWLAPNWADNAPQVAELLRQMGISTTNAPVADIALFPVGETQSHPLSAYKGKWIFLNFWATWCGPCRLELPTVEKLYQAMPKDQLAIFGISIDQGPASNVKKFLQQMGISFPNFQDQQGQAASAYHASSVPGVFLISPDWKMVGVVRGAKSWDTPQTLQNFRQLLAFKEVGDLSNVATTVAPSDLAPPTMKVRWQDGKTKLPIEHFLVDRPVELVVAVAWEGSAYRYAIKVPRVELPPTVKLGNISSQSQAQDGQAVLEYVYPLEFGQTGDQTIGPISLAFNDSSGQAAEQFARHEEMKIQVLSSPVFFRAMILLILCGVLTIAGGVWFKLKKRTPPARQLDELSIPKIAEEMKILKKQNWQGDQQGFCLGLLSLAQKCQLQGLAQLKWTTLEMESLKEKIRYGGQLLSEAEILYLEKQIINLSGKEQE